MPDTLGQVCQTHWSWVWHACSKGNYTKDYIRGQDSGLYVDGQILKIGSVVTWGNTDPK